MDTVLDARPIIDMWQMQSGKWRIIVKIDKEN